MLTMCAHAFYVVEHRGQFQVLKLKDGCD